MRKKFVMANIVTLALILIFDVWYMFGGGLFAKSIASIMFVGAGIVNYLYCAKNEVDLKFPRWMLVALTCAMLADIILVLNFYLGVAVFALGHVFYFVSYCMLGKINRKDLLCGVGIFTFALSVIQFAPFLDFGSGFMKNVCCGYEASKKYGKEIQSWFEQQILAATKILRYFDEKEVEQNREQKMYAEGFNANGGITLDASRFEVKDVYGAVQLFKKLLHF